MAQRLTALKVEKLKQPGRYADGDGLYLQIGPNGAKAWLFRYQLDGRERFMGLGSVKAFSLKEARERARKARQLHADGIDPIEHRLAQRDAKAKQARERVTFKEAATQFYDVHKDGWRSTKHARHWWKSLEDHAFPTLGQRPVTAIDDALTNAAMASLWKRAPVAATRTRDRIKRVVAWVRAGSPLPTRAGAEKRHHAALPWQEIPAFMAKLRQQPGVAARALEFTVLVGARSGETIGATWDEVDSASKIWTVPAERMKGGRPHRVPLSTAALEILEALPREEGNPFLFIGARDGKGIGESAMRGVLQNDLGRSSLTVHGMRSAFTDWAHEATSTPRTVVEAALAHAVGDQTEAAYRRGDLATKRAKLMADWAAYCASTPAEATPLPVSGDAQNVRFRG